MSQSGSQTPAATPSSAPSGRVAGVCHVMLAFDIAFSINLDEAEQAVRRAAADSHRLILSHRRKAPPHFEYRPPPLRITQPLEPIVAAVSPLEPSVDCTIYDFGGVSLAYRIRFDGALADLRSLSESLYANAALLEDGRRRAVALMSMFGTALSRPALQEAVEDYVIFQCERYPSAADLIEHERSSIAQILRADTRALSDDEIRDALACRISFEQGDATLIDWHAAMLFDDEGTDVLSILEFVNMELLEMRVLDDRLDRVLEAFYQAMSARRFGGLTGGLKRRDLLRLATLQTDSALLFEGVNNSLKLVGDQYLARVYRLAAERMRLPDWDASILRKLGTAESIYSKISEHQGARRMEVLEWIIIVLITISILMMFVPVGGGH